VATRSEARALLKELALRGGRLPSMRELSVRWNTSTRTLHEAVRLGVAEGWLETKPGSGIWPRGQAPVPREAPAGRLGRDGLAEAIRAGIEAGVHPLGIALPTVKDLARIHELHPTTVRRGLEQLAEDGLLERKGRSWSVVRPKAQASGARVLLCIGAADREGRIRMDSDREWDFWREIQAEALRNGLVPQLVPWDGARIDLGAPSLLGVVVCTWHMIDFQPLLDAIARKGLPCAVWIVSRLPGSDAGNRKIRTQWFHDMAFGREAGQAMATYLRGSGHTKVAWISPFHENAWARNRLEGLLAGSRGALDVVPVLGRWQSEWDLHDSLLGERSAWERRLHPQLRTPDSRSDLGDLVRPQIETITRDRFLRELTPALEAALRGGATLWLAASDLIADWTLHWLESRGLRVPADLAMASFDDTRAASRLGLTSMRFDTTAMARAMLLQVLSSRNAHRHLTHYQGTIVPRMSSSAPRGRSAIKR